MIKKLVLFLTLINLFMNTSLTAKNANVEDLKVAYIYNFIKYVKWPTSRENEKVFHICVDKNSELKLKLMVLNKKSVRGKSIEVRLISNREENFSQCDMLVLPQLEQANLKSLLEHAASSSILTVSDTEGYADLGVMINLIVVNHKIRFEVNLGKVESAKLTMSSNLLKLAKLVQSE